MIAWWVRHDQRLSDNICWDSARELAEATGQELCAVYAWNHLDQAKGLGGIPRLSPRRTEWIREGLSALGHELESHGVALQHTPGSITDWLRANRPHTLLFSRAVATEERQRESEVNAL